MSSEKRVYVPVDPSAVDLVIAVVVPTGKHDEALVVETFKSGNVRSSWGEDTMSDTIYRSGGMRRNGGTPVPPEMQAVIDRRWPEHLTWAPYP